MSSNGMSRARFIQSFTAFLLTVTLFAPDVILTVRAQGAQEASIALMREIARGLNDAPVVSGRFEQAKTIAGFKKPLLSSGEFFTAREHGIVWHTLAPFDSRLILSKDRIASQQGQGELQTLIDGRDNPALQAINEILFAIMTADLPLLSKEFDVSGDVSSDRGWALTLKPRNAALKQWMEQVQLWGDQYVHKVVLLEPQGDQSTIVLGEHQAGSKVPDALQAH